MWLAPLLILFIKGILIGFAIAAPVGPIGIMCIRRSLAGHYGMSLIIGLGSGLADTVYGAIAGFSLASIVDILHHYNFCLRLFGGLLVGWIGISTFRAPYQQTTPESFQTDTHFHSFISAFLLTLSNPLTLIVFGAAFAAMGISHMDDSWIQPSFLVAGVFVGATGWWFSLSTAVRLMHRRLSGTQLLWINRISGTLLIGFSLYMIGSIL